MTAENVPGAGALPPVELAKIYENLGHEVAQDSPKMAMDLLDKANDLRVQANQEMLADEKATEADAAQIADQIGMNEERKAKFLAEVRSVLRNSRESI
ncbi:hypothetical protein KJZ63_02990 [Patescibacteria group bacterium]|nr:hypothetical protein [Patescibacteria group bacterium]